MFSGIGKPNIPHPRVFIYSMPEGILFSCLFSGSDGDDDDDDVCRLQ